VAPDLSLNEDDLFEEFSYVQKYCESKLEVWNEKMSKMLTKKCWEMLTHFTKEIINAVNVSCFFFSDVLVFRGKMEMSHFVEKILWES
jgi:hypothetical protein